MEQESSTVPASVANNSAKQVNFRFAYSVNAPSLLAQLKCTLLVSTYRTGFLIALSHRNGAVVPSHQILDRPMGMAVQDNCIAVGTRNQIWFFTASPDVAAKLEPRGQYDACYLARFAQFTGDLLCHEIAYLKKELWIVNTKFSCLCSLHSGYNFAPRWRPPFLSALLPEDRCHLNGLAIADGLPRYVSALAETDSREGWRAVKATGGCLIEVASSATIVRGLTMPHSPRLSQGKLYVLNSGIGCLEVVNPANGQRDVVCRLPGYARGLAIIGSLAFVGLSKIRSTSEFEGVPIASQPEQLKCGVWVVDLNKGIVVCTFEFISGVDELFDVQLMPGVSFPYISGPYEENAIWAVMPTT
jgi:uncharacterized protein (TIGR03032 family)